MKPDQDYEILPTRVDQRERPILLTWYFSKWWRKRWNLHNFTHTPPISCSHHCCKGRVWLALIASVTQAGYHSPLSHCEAIKLSPLTAASCKTISQNETHLFRELSKNVLIVSWAHLEQQQTRKERPVLQQLIWWARCWLSCKQCLVWVWVKAQNRQNKLQEDHQEIFYNKPHSWTWRTFQRQTKANWLKLKLSRAQSQQPRYAQRIKDVTRRIMEINENFFLLHKSSPPPQSKVLSVKTLDWRRADFCHMSNIDLRKKTESCKNL